MSESNRLPASLTIMLDSFALSLRAAGKSPTTIERYTSATLKLARWLSQQPKPISNWANVTKRHLDEYQAWFQQHGISCRCGKPGSHDDSACPSGRPYSRGYANNQYRGYQQFFKWLALEEDVPNPMLSTTPPKIDEEEHLVAVFGDTELARLITQCEKGRDFESRRDTALLRLFACTGGRLSELTLLTVEDLNMTMFEVTVLGKGRKRRILKFDAKCAQALDRYLRARSTHRHAARTKKLWIGVNSGGALTPNGVRKMIKRRGRAVGMEIFPHQFRHNFSHRWLDAGGAEGDLMELNGWDSPQMLRRYGRSARSARARRAYDRVNVMGDI